MADPTPERPKPELPTQFGTAAALSSSSENIRIPGHVPGHLPGHVPVRTPKLTEAQTAAGVDPLATAAGVTASGFRSAAGLQGLHGDDTALEPGTVLAGRYEILDVLGRGGMGSVYKAQDRELSRLVALKVIRPELARNAAIVERFKQELRLSHLVTHKNVIRMYDLGEDAGLRFITMEFVEGRDLRSMIEERGKLPPAETVVILQQICCALEAAHAVGILHRDLKPQNIMQDAHGRVVVMDFGLARTIEGDGMTQSGALVGTMEYMSPEQALGKELDQRSDIFALGLICYEMLTGKMPFRAESALASLIKRTQQRADSVTNFDPSIPGALSGIVAKCLERDVELRYKNTGEVLHDLEAWEGKRAAAARLRFHANVASGGLSGRWLLVTGGAVLLALLVLAGVMVMRRVGPGRAGGQKAAVTPAISLAIMPFYNASADAKLDWLGASLAEMLSSDIGGSQRVRMVSPDRLHQALEDLHISGTAQVDVGVLRRVAEFTNAETIVFGQYVRAGEQIRIDTTILDLAHDRRTVIRTDVPSEKDVLTSVDALAGQVREQLAADPDVLKELKAHAERPSTNSVEALRAYDDGLELARKGNNLGALEQFKASTAQDPRFALAFAKLGQTYQKLRHDEEAEQASRRAMELSDSLPSQEKYLIEANHARITKNTAKAIEAFEHIASDNPADADVQFELAELYEQNGDYPAAKHRLATVLANDPKNVDVLLASGRVEIQSGNPQGGLDFLSRALSLAIQFGNDEQKATVLQAMGIAYGMLNKPEEALRNYQESLAIKEKIGDKGGAAASLEEIASLQDTAGHPDEALKSYREALAQRQAIGDKVGIGNTLIDTGSFFHDHGRTDEALKYFTDALQIERELGNQSNQALCLTNIGVIRLDRGEYQDALTYLDEGYQLRLKLKVPADIAESLHNLAEANTKLGQYDAALDLYLKAIEARRSTNDQRGVALEAESMARIFAAQGRYGAALSSMQQALKIFEETKERTSFTVGVVGGWGDLLSQVGRGDEGRPSLDDALSIARQIKNDASVAAATNWIGDEYYYKGDYFAARQQYDAALSVGAKTTDKEQALLAKVNKAKVELALGHAPAVMPALRKLAQDADALGLKPVAVECAVYLGQGLTASKSYPAARTQLETALGRAQKLGLRVLEAKAQYQLAVLLTDSGAGKEATPHYREVVRILEGISKEENAARVLERADLQGMYREATKAFQGGG